MFQLYFDSSKAFFEEEQVSLKPQSRALSLLLFTVLVKALAELASFLMFLA